MFSPYAESTPLKTLEEAAPAFGVLVSIGLPAIPEAVDRLKKCDPGNEEIVILGRLVERIYTQGQLQLRCSSRNDFQQELLAPTATATPLT